MYLKLGKVAASGSEDFFAFHRFAVIKLEHLRAWRPFFALHRFAVAKLEKKFGYCFWVPHFRNASTIAGNT